MTALALQPVTARGAASFPGSAGYVPSVRGPEARRLAFEARQVRAAREAAVQAVAARDLGATPTQAPSIIVHPPRVLATAVVHADPRLAACTRPNLCGSRARAASKRTASLTAA